MRNARRSNAQLKRTSERRAHALAFMKRFNADLLWTQDAPIDTDLDEIMAFAFEGGMAIIQTYEGSSPLWRIYTEPSTSGDLDELEQAMRLQIDERNFGADAPLSGAWVAKMLERMIPRMSDETLKRSADLFDRALMDGEEAAAPDDGSYTDDPRLVVRIPVEGMTPRGFPEPGPAVGDGLSPEDEAVLFATGHLPEDF